MNRPEQLSGLSDFLRISTLKILIWTPQNEKFLKVFDGSKNRQNFFLTEKRTELVCASVTALNNGFYALMLPPEKEVNRGVLVFIQQGFGILSGSCSSAVEHFLGKEEVMGSIPIKSSGVCLKHNLIQ